MSIFVSKVYACIANDPAKARRFHMFQCVADDPGVASIRLARLANLSELRVIYKGHDGLLDSRAVSPHDMMPRKVA